MRMSVRRTVSETIDNVDVDVSSVLYNIYESSIPVGLDYLAKDGYWYKQKGYDYHKREETYTKDRAASDAEIQLKVAYDTLVAYVNAERL